MVRTAQSITLIAHGLSGPSGPLSTALIAAICRSNIHDNEWFSFSRARSSGREYLSPHKANNTWVWHITITCEHPPTHDVYLWIFAHVYCGKRLLTIVADSSSPNSATRSLHLISRYHLCCRSIDLNRTQLNSIACNSPARGILLFALFMRWSMEILFPIQSHESDLSQCYSNEELIKSGVAKTTHTECVVSNKMHNLRHLSIIVLSHETGYRFACVWSTWNSEHQAREYGQNTMKVVSVWSAWIATKTLTDRGLKEKSSDSNIPDTSGFVCSLNQMVATSVVFVGAASEPLGY